MRSNSTTTTQTTCDADYCHAYAITGHYQPATPEQRETAHRTSLAADGWVDYEGRDYCPDDDPHQQQSANTAA